VTAVDARDRALSLAASVVVEADGTTWGEQATDLQLEDMRRAVDAEGPRLGFVTRPRGGGKTRDLAIALVAVALTQLPPGSACHGAAVDGDQARLLLDSIRQIAERTPSLRGLFTFTATRATCPTRGVTIEVLPADGPGAYGLRSRFLVVDEIFQWPDTPRHRSFWEALLSTVQKDRACRLALLSTAGHPDHWAVPLWERAGTSAAWWRSQHPGPPAWQSVEVIAELRATLPDGAFRRLVLNEFAAGADQALATEAELARIFREPGEEHVGGKRGPRCVGLDLAVTGDNAGLALARLAGQRVVVDATRTWTPTPGHPISQEAVFEEVLRIDREDGPVTVLADAYQSVGLLERLRRRGVACESFAYGAKSKSGLGAMALRLVREGAWSLPADPELLADFRSLRVVERPDGTFYVEAPRTRRGHGDTAEAVILASHWLLQNQPHFLRTGTLSSGYFVWDDETPERFGGMGEREWLASGAGKKAAAHRGGDLGLAGRR
jgi:hypothetical protein